MPNDNDLIFSPSPSVFPHAIGKFPYSGTLFFAILGLGTREADETRVVQPDRGFSVLVRSVEGGEESTRGRGIDAACPVVSRVEV